MTRDDSQIAKLDVVDYDPTTGEPLYVLHGDDVYRCVLLTPEEIEREESVKFSAAAEVGGIGAGKRPR